MAQVAASPVADAAQVAAAVALVNVANLAGKPAPQPQRLLYKSVHEKSERGTLWP